MTYEYIILNIIIITGPLILSFDRKVQYYRRWKTAFIAILTVMIPFTVWDILVTGKYWWFNENYTLPFRLAGLPPGEWLFFISAPFAVLFIWEIIDKRMGNPVNSPFVLFKYVFMALGLPGIVLLIIGKLYTGLTFLALGVTGLLDYLLRTEVLARKRILLFLGILMILILIFNGYLTARPIVLYDYKYQLDWQIFTIPIEDFGYGLALILLNTILFEKLKRIRHG
jgi:lycopene cyclase domain-containing protein